MLTLLMLTQNLASGKTVHQVGMIFNQTARNLVQIDWI
jgi:hypothetical protein